VLLAVALVALAPVALDELAAVSCCNRLSNACSRLPLADAAVLPVVLLVLLVLPLRALLKFDDMEPLS
jgi:hypothetical protein